MNRLWMIVIMAGLLAGCAARGPVVDHSDDYMRHAGNPVTQVRYSSIRNWRAVGSEMIMMDFGARGQYLFELSPECHSRFNTGLKIGVDSYRSNVIDTSDRIIIDEVHRCRIMSIRSVDMSAVREDLAGRGAESEDSPVQNH